MLAALGLRKQAVLLDLAGEFLESGLEGLALPDQNFAHSYGIATKRTPAALRLRAPFCAGL